MVQEKSELEKRNSSVRNVNIKYSAECPFRILKYIKSKTVCYRMKRNLIFKFYASIYFSI